MDLKLFKPEEWWWEHEYIDSSIFTKTDLKLFSLKQQCLDIWLWWSITIPSVTTSVFLTHISIRQMLTWLPMRKAKSLYHVSTFLPTWFFLPLRKFKTIKIKPEKISYTQTIRAYCMFQGTLKIFSNIYALLFVSLFLLIVAVCHFFNIY